jgi:KDO2-lipid IV(A) lauroyltransferase
VFKRFDLQETPPRVGQRAGPAKTPSLFKRVRYLLEAAGVTLFAAYVRLWPRTIVMWGANLIGLAACLVLPEYRRVAYANLYLALGDGCSSQEKRRIVRGTFQQLSRSLIGLLWMPRLSRRRCLEWVDATDALEILRPLKAQRRGVVIVTCHYGDWELLCGTAGHIDLPLMIVTEPVANLRLDRMLQRLRACTGNTPVPPRHAVLKLYRGLRQGGRVALVVDVNGRRGRGGVWLDFLGRKVFNGSGAAELALRTGAAVVFVAAQPLPKGRMKILCRPVDYTATGDHAADVQNLSQQCLDCCRDLILQDPSPWLWTSKRWKRRPTLRNDGYPFYSKYVPDQKPEETRMQNEERKMQIAK